MLGYWLVITIQENFIGVTRCLTATSPQASSKKTVAELCNLAASTLVDVTDSSLTQQVQAALDLKETEALQLSQALRALLRAAVYHGTCVYHGMFSQFALVRAAD